MWPNGVGDAGLGIWCFCDYSQGQVTIVEHGEHRVVKTPSGEADGMAFDVDDGLWVAQPRAGSLVASHARRQGRSHPRSSGVQPASLAFDDDVLYVTRSPPRHGRASSFASTRPSPGAAITTQPSEEISIMADVVLVDVTDRVATITLNRPDQRNALSTEVLRVLPRAVAECDARDDVDVMILTGADPAFSAGIDLKELGSRSGNSGMAAPPTDRRGPLPSHAKPLIGAINGVAVTGGFELALACDFLIASDRARFADTHSRVGIQPGWGLTVLLAEAVGVRRARELSATGNFLDANTALTWDS